jgi:hypothetical protein
MFSLKKNKKAKIKLYSLLFSFFMGKFFLIFFSKKGKNEIYYAKTHTHTRY